MIAMTLTHVDEKGVPANDEKWWRATGDLREINETHCGGNPVMAQVIGLTSRPEPVYPVSVSHA